MKLASLVRLVLIPGICSSASLHPVISLADSGPAADHASSAANPPSVQSDAGPPRFGFGLGLGYQTITGNRGIVYQQDAPAYELKGLYWLTPQLALELVGSQVRDFYQTDASQGGHVDVNLMHLEAATRYYIDPSAFSPTSGFLSPFAEIGVAVFSQSKSSFSQATSEPAETHLGMTLGAGLKFKLVPRSIYLEFEGKWDSVSFNDTNSQAFAGSNGVPDLTGQFFVWTGSVLITL